MPCEKDTNKNRCFICVQDGMLHELIFSSKHCVTFFSYDSRHIFELRFNEEINEDYRITFVPVSTEVAIKADTAFMIKQRKT